MNKYLFQLSFLFFSINISHSQLISWNNKVDFGIVNNTSQGYVDIPLKNNSTNLIFIFRLDVDKRFKVQYSNKKIAPDSTVFIRLSFSPTQKGYFKEQIPIHFSCYDQPEIMEFSGFTEEILAYNIACPSFREVNSTNHLAVDFSTSIKDDISNETLSNYNITLIKDGLAVVEDYNQKKGSFKKRIPLGLYYVIAEKEGYKTYEKLCYVNSKNNALTIPLIPIKTIALVENSTTIIDNTLPVEKAIPQIDSFINIAEEEIILTNYTKEFNEINYQPNNIVFLLDVSTSMKYNGKLELLKSSMQELTKMLRPIDKVTIIGYSSRASVILNTTSGENKDSITQKIIELKARGLTAGGKGLKLAYEKAKNEYIKNGNNQVIIATDGDFNEGDENVNKLAKKVKKSGLIISVIGIKAKQIPEENMKALAKLGGGNYIAINSYENACKSLVNEIKINSFKGLKK